MFSSDQLSQLSQLKQDIRSNRDIQQGIVRGTSGRYGFVTLDDGRDAFLNPEQMERVFPGDKVEVEVKTIEQNGKEQYEASLEKLIESPASYLSGRYRVRGKGHFIATDLPHFSRWIFIPPKDRAKCEDGHYASAKITRHPFKDGKAQAKILKNIGSADTDYIERLYTTEKYQLNKPTPKPVQEQAQTLLEKVITPEHYPDHQDLSHLPFVTIDSAATRDMDDALTIEATETGWRLHVAIADPGADVERKSALDQYALERGQTVYFPGKPLPMLPESLSIERYSLKPNEKRLGLVFQCDINTAGEISDASFIPAIVCSHAKLSYAQVAALIEGQEFDTPDHLSDATPFKEQLLALHSCALALHQYREQHCIVTENKADFALFLNEKGKLSSIEKIERNCAHIIVEEAMLATNRYAGEFLAQHKTGLFIHHRGYREERRPDIEALLTEKTGSTIENTHELAPFVHTVKALQGNNDWHYLVSVQQRFLEASQFCNTPAPHFGLGFQYYATVTSPIRRYQDLHNQRLIHALLKGQAASTLGDKPLEKLQNTVSDSRDAVRFMEQWLISDYMREHIGKTFTGTVSLLTNQGVGIRLNDTGIEGFIAAKRPDKKNPDITADKISFNNQRMELLWNNQPVMLDQTVSVTLTGIDESRKKLELYWVDMPSQQEPSASTPVAEQE